MVFERQPSAVLRACSHLLRPDSNCSADWRTAALEAMARAMEEFLGGEDIDDAAHAAVWGEEVLQSLFFSLLHDPSIKVHAHALRSSIVLCLVRIVSIHI